MSDSIAWSSKLCPLDASESDSTVASRSTSRFVPHETVDGVFAEEHVCADCVVILDVADVTVHDDVEGPSSSGWGRARAKGIAQSGVVGSVRVSVLEGHVLRSLTLA